MPDRDGSWKEGVLVGIYRRLKTLELLPRAAGCMVPWTGWYSGGSSTMPRVILKTCSNYHRVCEFEVVPNLSRVYLGGMVYFE